MKMKRNKSNIYSVRLSAMDFKALDTAASAHSVPRSVFVRQLLDDAIKAYRTFDKNPNQLDLF